LRYQFIFKHSFIKMVCVINIDSNTRS